MVLGVTSAKIRIIKVKRRETYKIPTSPHILIAMIVAKAEARILTKLLPIKIKPKSLSVLDNNFVTLLAPLCLFLTKCFSLYLFIAIMLVSELEKKADKSTSTPTREKRIQIGISFNGIKL